MAEIQTPCKFYILLILFLSSFCSLLRKTNYRHGFQASYRTSPNHSFHRTYAKSRAGRWIQTLGFPCTWRICESDSWITLKIHSWWIANQCAQSSTVDDCRLSYCIGCGNGIWLASIMPVQRAKLFGPQILSLHVNASLYSLSMMFKQFPAALYWGRPAT